MKENILKLRAEGKSYTQIMKELGCSKTIICYYCGVNQKEKAVIRNKKRSKTLHPFELKIKRFLTKNKLNVKTLTNKTDDYHCFHSKIGKFNMEKGKYMSRTFNVNDIIDKFGDNPKCYLTGEEIDIHKPRTYEFDHIIPKSRGGTNTLDNLGICTKQANRAKNDMTPDEFVNLCKLVVKHNTKI